ncbi:MAG TPA: histidine triad nucleotide-binding protein [Terrimicrobiaceae bacterium]|nr:histidine triad nucleotide-binding protein [Terrimicrobiaceae bacterium]
MTLFERIINREVPAQIIHEDDRCMAIRDINPQAPVHVLVIPKKLIPRLGEAAAGDAGVLGHLLLVAAAIAKREGIEESGYRVVLNHGRHAGESVPHLHVHLLGGRQMKWPPG